MLTYAQVSSGSLRNYNGNGKYLADEALKLLPVMSASAPPPIMPGYNVFGDSMFFGEGQLKDRFIQVCACACGCGCLFFWGDVLIDSWSRCKEMGADQWGRS
jgi:hypothetical protein